MDEKMGSESAINVEEKQEERKSPSVDSVEEFLRDIPSCYIEAIREPGTYWGGDIEVGRIASLYNVAIVVYRKKENEEGFERDVINQHSENTIFLRFNGDHYDLLKDDNPEDYWSVNGDGDCLFNA